MFLLLLFLFGSFILFIYSFVYFLVWDQGSCFPWVWKQPRTREKEAKYKPQEEAGVQDRFYFFWNPEQHIMCREKDKLSFALRVKTCVLLLASGCFLAPTGLSFHLYHCVGEQSRGVTVNTQLKKSSGLQPEPLRNSIYTVESRLSL